MILRLEVNDVADVRGRRALRLLRITQTNRGGAYRFAPSRQSVSIKGAHAKLFEQQRFGVFTLPEPIIKWSECGGQAARIRSQGSGASSRSHWEKVRACSNRR